MPQLYCPTALLPTGWEPNVTLTWDDDGTITSVQTDEKPTAAATRAGGPVLPGVPNVHSHAFQRGMAALAEHAAPGQDDFWTWRSAMYRFVDRLEPDDVEAIAAQLYLDLLRHGYTTVAEFHYIHHPPHENHYPEFAEMALRHVRAARRVGIRLTMLPVLYSRGGFDGTPLKGGQRRFENDVNGILKLVDELIAATVDDEDVRVGFAAHSLRAVGAAQLTEVVAALNDRDAQMPLHIHVAEQVAEVEQCLAATKLRPVEYLASLVDLSARWCLIHATHLTEAEIELLAGSKCTVGLCPTTEANLGDGLFPAERYLQQDGRFAVGSDSHVSVSPWEELRTLEYGQRLTKQRRNILTVDNHSTGRTLFDRAVANGAAACGAPIGRLDVGARADLLVADPKQPHLAHREGDALLDALVFCGDASSIRDVYVAGKQVIDNRTHVHADDISATYRERIKRLIMGNE